MSLCTLCYVTPPPSARISSLNPFGLSTFHMCVTVFALTPATHRFRPPSPNENDPAHARARTDFETAVTSAVAPLQELNEDVITRVITRFSHDHLCESQQLALMRLKMKARL